MSFSKAILFSAATLVLPFMSFATPVVPSPTLSVAGLNFNNFTCSVTGEGPAFPSKCGSIDVATITHPGNGIQISSGFTAFPFSFSDATINYHVSSAAGIDMVGLDFNGSFHGYAISSVTETIYNAAGTQVGFASVSCAKGFLGGCERTDNIHLNGSYNDLYIQKDINVSSFIGEAQISYIDQTFSTATAPEPSSIALLGSGLLTAAALLRRRAKLFVAKGAIQA